MEIHNDVVQRAKHSIKGKVTTVSLALLVLLVVNAVAGFVVQLMFTHNNVNTVMEKNLDSTKNFVNGGLQNLVILLNDHSRDYEFINGTADEKSTHAISLAQYDPTVKQTVFADAQGNMYGGEIPSEIMTALQSKTMAATTPNDLNSTFWLAVKNDAGGVLASEITTEKLSGILSSAAGDAYLLNSKGTVIGASVKSGGGVPTDFEKYVQNSGESMVSNQPTNYNGINNCFAAYGVEQSDNWTVLIAIPAGQYYSGLMISLASSVVVILLMIAWGILVNIYFSKKLIAPINNILHKIVEISNGNLSGNALEIRSEDELGVLGDSVNVMAEYNRRIIGDIQYTAEEIAKQNLCVKPQAEYSGDYLPVKNALESIVNSMREVVINIDNAGREVNLRSAQMSENSAMLSRAADEQSQTVQDLNDKLNDVHNQITQSTEKAALAREMTEMSVKSINEGNEKMERMLAAMEEINSTSSEIANIIKTIQDISFQTNILSLNASIEAARAGEAGKGFAVVAGEVGNLANKTAEAAKSTTGLIETSVKAVKNGTVIANETAEMLEMIVGKAAESANVVNEIADASVKQAESIQSVLERMNGISAAVTQVSDASCECASSSETLAEQSAMLKETVNKFVVDGSAPNPVAKAKASNAVSKPVETPKPVTKTESVKPPKTITMPDDEKPTPVKAETKSTPKMETKPTPKAETKPTTKTMQKPTAAAPSKPVSAPAKTITLPDDEKAPIKAAESKPVPKPAAKPTPTSKANPSKSVSTPTAKPKISLPDDDDEDLFVSAPTSKVVSKATMKPVNYTVKMDPNKY